MNTTRSNSYRLLWLRFTAFFVLTFVCLSVPVSAQQGGTTGTVTGTVTNKATGFALNSAIVTVQSTHASVVTKRDGSFSISAPVGPQKITIEYAGLDPENLSVDIVAGRPTNEDVQMSSDVYALDKFVVEGTREGNAAAQQRQRAAINPMTVVAADAFGLPEANPGELIQRLPGVSVGIVGSEVRNILIRGMNQDFITVQVDGNQMASSAGSSASRQFQIEQMGTGNIESVEIIKQNTPDRDANAVAGFVNLVTRRAFDTPGQQIQLTGGMLWRDGDFHSAGFDEKPFKNSGNTFGLQYANSFSVFGGVHNLGVAFNVDQRRSATIQDEAGGYGNGLPQLIQIGGGQTLVNNFGFGEFYYPAISRNVGLNIDYKLGANAVAYLRIAGNTNYQYQQYHRVVITTSYPNEPLAAALSNFTAASTPAFQETLANTPTGDGNLGLMNTGYFTKKSKNYSVNPGFSVKLMDNTATLDVDYSHSYADVWYPGYNMTTSYFGDGSGFEPAQQFSWSLDYRGGDQRHPILKQTSGPSWSNPDNWLMAGNGVGSGDTKIAQDAPDKVDSFKVDFLKDLPTSVPTYIKVGVKYGKDARSQRTTSTNYSSWAGGLGIRPYTAQNDTFFGGQYGWGPIPFLVAPGSGAPGDIMQSGLLTQSNADSYNSGTSSTANNASFTEAISALYLMGGVTIDKLKIMAGVRVEQTEVTGNGYARSSNPLYNYSAANSPAVNYANAVARFTPISAHSNYRRVHPSVEMTYEPIKDLIFRAGANTSISRPAVNNILPIATINLGTKTITAGNPSLKPFISNNLDLAVEKYFNPGGLFSIGFFNKDITNYITPAAPFLIPAGGANGFDGQYAGYTLSSFQNLGYARIQGFEISYQQQLSFLPGFLKGFGVGANETIVHSIGNYGIIPGGVPFPGNGLGPLIGLVPHQTNLSLNYTAYGLDLRLMENIRGRYIDGIYDPTDFSKNIIQDKRRIIDLKARYTFGPRSQYDVFLTIDNLTNQPTSTIDILNRETFTLYQGTGYTFGFNTRF